MRILITGGLGFIGTALIEKLLKIEEAVVLNIDKKTYASNLDAEEHFLEHNNYQSITGDICEKRTVELAFLTFNPEIVLNLAAETHVDRSIAEPNDFVKTNILGTQVLLTCASKYYQSLTNQARENFRYIQVSTDEVYGSLQASGQFDECSNLRPNSPYSASKCAADLLTRAWNKTYSLPTVTTRCSNNFGPRQNKEKFIPSIISSLMKNEPIRIYGNGKNIRDWIFVEDHAEALVKVMLNAEAGQTYNIGGNKELSNLELARMVFEEFLALTNSSNPVESLFDKQIRFVEDRKGHDFRYSIDSTRIQEALDWRPKKAFVEGLRETISWYLNKKIP